MIAKRVHRAANDVCGCERYSMSDDSPGVVQDDEILELVISDPNSLLPDGFINPTMFVPMDKAGLSVLRGAAVDNEFEQTIVELRTRSAQQGKERYFHGICEFKAEVVRVDGGVRLCGVYDTALPGKPHHADVIATDMHVVTTASKGEIEKDRRKRYKRMLELVGNSFIPGRLFRGGAFAQHMR